MVEAAEKTPKPWRTGADLVDASATWSIGPGILYQMGNQQPRPRNSVAQWPSSSIKGATKGSSFRPEWSEWASNLQLMCQNVLMIPKRILVFTSPRFVDILTWCSSYIQHYTTSILAWNHMEPPDLRWFPQLVNHPVGDFPAMTSQPPGAEGSWFWMYLPWRHVQGAIHTAFPRDGVKSWPEMGEDLGKSWVCPKMGYTPRFRVF